MEEYKNLLKDKRALSKNQMLESNFPYYEYTDNISEGEYLAVLDMKEWGKQSSLHCFFTVEGKYRIRLITYIENKYKPIFSKIDFSDKEIVPGMKFKLKITINKKGNQKWNDAIKI